jgi:hypothetical protein
MTKFNLPTKLAAVMLLFGTGVTAPARADNYYVVRPGPSFELEAQPPIDALGAYYDSQKASQQAELNRLEIERRRLEIERVRSGQRDRFCRLADGRFEPC